MFVAMPIDADMDVMEINFGFEILSVAGVVINKEKPNEEEKTNKEEKDNPIDISKSNEIEDV